MNIAEIKIENSLLSFLNLNEEKGLYNYIKIIYIYTYNSNLEKDRNDQIILRIPYMAKIRTQLTPLESRRTSSSTTILPIYQPVESVNYLLR